jgi:L-threonylcarbamoyladenylate synthase
MNQQIDRAGAIIQSGGLVIFPTHGLYGIGADALNHAAVARVFGLKGRPADKPLLVLISRQDMLGQLTADVPPLAERLMQRFWPGRVTLVFNARPGLPTGLLSASGKIGVRWVAHPVAAALVTAVGRPITGTSANLSGEKGCACVDEIPQAVLDRVEMVLDAGLLAGGPGSTVVDVTGAEPVILRHGALTAEELLDEVQ